MRDSKGVNKVTDGMRTIVGKGTASLTDSSGSIDPENTIANPDNIVVLPDGRVDIGEDSAAHKPNMLWVYKPPHANR